MSASVSRLSKQPVYVPVMGFREGVNTTPVALPVAIAFSVPGELPTVWHQAVWEMEPPVLPRGQSSGGSFYASVIVGPGAVELAPGEWETWLRITGASSVPVESAGILEVL